MLVFVVVVLKILIPLFFLTNNKIIHKNKLVPRLRITVISIYIGKKQPPKRKKIDNNMLTNFYKKKPTIQAYLFLKLISC